MFGAITETPRGNFQRSECPSANGQLNGVPRSHRDLPKYDNGTVVELTLSQSTRDRLTSKHGRKLSEQHGQSEQCCQHSRPDNHVSAL